MSHKVLLFILLIILINTSCNSTEPEDFRTSKLSAILIKTIQIDTTRVTLDLSVGIPTPCWEYFRTDIVQNGEGAFLTIYGQDKSEACIQVLSSFERRETIIFQTKGEKRIKFWSSDSTTIDTTIIIE